ncbi:MAG: 4'-phosphopantetheinyl transferase superfamily protein [Desulfobulbaceae bacterium]|nr:4'-phosphopantetheinyl transferase superfamily protein [Desulfobulbaceae bacterium]HIJ90323.1 4'-phosphopantetheinyl transferase superfamily protein [Deltaproteobacteria bacterium]
MALVQAIFEEYWPHWQHHFTPEARLRLGGVPLAALPARADIMQPGLASEYLSPDELEQWRGFNLEKRRAEWLGGRIAAKWAAAGLLGETAMTWRNLVIRTEAGGRPYVATETHAAPPFISISHSGPLAAALAANFPCGLDIQEPGAKIHTVRDRFVSPEEEDILSASLPESFTETERLTMLWAAKEAIRKMVRTTPLPGFLEIRLLANHAGCGTQADPLTLTFASNRDQDGCPPTITVLSFFADNLAWAMGCLPTRKE